MHMLRHEDISPQIKGVRRSSRIDRINQELTETVLRKELTLAVAAKRQRMGMTGRIPAPTTLTVSLAVSHTFRPIAKLPLDAATRLLFAHRDFMPLAYSVELTSPVQLIVAIESY